MKVGVRNGNCGEGPEAEQKHGTRETRDFTLSTSLEHADALRVDSSTTYFRSSAKMS